MAGEGMRRLLEKKDEYKRRCNSQERQIKELQALIIGIGLCQVVPFNNASICVVFPKPLYDKVAIEFDLIQGKKRGGF